MAIHAATEDPRTDAVILVEGPSDAAVLEVLTSRLGLGGRRVTIVPMGGATNIRSYLGAVRRDVAAGGLCDSSEERFFIRALRDLGHHVTGREDLGSLGFFVCDADLEDELIRAVGVSAVVRVIEREGEGDLLRLFQQQPAQRERPLAEQLHRFAGVKSGRKVRLAAALAAELSLDNVPAPLLRVLRFAHAAAA